MNLIDYLQSIPGTPPINEKDNPATWMLGACCTQQAGRDRGGLGLACCSLGCLPAYLPACLPACQALPSIQH